MNRSTAIRYSDAASLPFMRLAALLLAAALLAACAQPARVSQMAVPNVMAATVSAKPSMQGALAVGEVTGGQATNPLWTSQINNPEFKEALDLSLQTNGVLADKPGNARYTVSANLVSLHQPLIGASFTVTPTVSYKVVERSSSAVVLDEQFVTPFTAPFSSSLIAVERLRIASEGAIRVSIERFLTRLGEVWGPNGITPGSLPAAPAAPAAAGKPTS